MAAMRALQIFVDGTAEVYHLDSKTLTTIITDGLGMYVNGEYVLHRINTLASGAQLVRLGDNLKAGFIKYCDGKLWTQARDIANALINGTTFLQADYDLIDGLLPA